MANTTPTLTIGQQDRRIVEDGYNYDYSPNPNATIQLTTADADAGDVASFDATGWTVVNGDPTKLSKKGTYGSVVLDTTTGELDYKLDDARPATNALSENQSASDAFTVTVKDTFGASVTKTARFAIIGADDPTTATFSPQSAAIVEAGVAPGHASASITIALSDPDNAVGFSNTLATDGWADKGSDLFQKRGEYGSVTFNTQTGVMSYTLDDAREKTNALASGAIATESFAVRFTPGGGGTATFTISGANDAPAIVASALLPGDGAITRVSTASDGTQANGQSFGAAVSPDGSKVAFYASAAASNLTPGDTNGFQDLFVKDLKTGAVTLVSKAADGTPGDSATDSGTPPAFSPDGTKVAFISYASNLVPGDTNGAIDAFVKDLVTGTVTRVSQTVNGVQANADSYGTLFFTPDGSKIIFGSSATNLGASASGSLLQKDLATGVVTRVFPEGSVATGQVAFSPDGSNIVFQGSAYIYSHQDEHAQYLPVQLFTQNLATGVITPITRDPTGSYWSSGGNHDAVFSPDGTKILFTSEAYDWGGDYGSASDIFVYDIGTKKVSDISTAADGTFSNGVSKNAVFSADGKSVIFQSSATNLVPDDTNGVADLFVKDLATGAIRRITTGVGGTQSNGDFTYTTGLSADGTTLIFTSKASNLVAGDTNGAADVFAQAIGTRVKTSTSASIIDDPTQSVLSASGALAFADVDNTDTHTVGVTAAAGALGDLVATVERDTTGGVTGVVGWAYQVNHTAASGLGVGESHVDHFVVAIDDGHGGVVQQAVDVTVFGTGSVIAPTVTSAGLDQTTGGAAPELVVAGSAAANASVALYDGATLLQTVSADSSGAYSTVLADLGDGFHAITATASVGGVTSASAQVGLVLVSSSADLPGRVTTSASAPTLVWVTDPKSIIKADMGQLAATRAALSHSSHHGLLAVADTAANIYPALATLDAATDVSLILLTGEPVFMLASSGLVQRTVAQHAAALAKIATDFEFGVHDDGAGENVDRTNYFSRTGKPTRVHIEVTTDTGSTVYDSYYQASPYTFVTSVYDLAGNLIDRKAMLPGGGFDRTQTGLSGDGYTSQIVRVQSNGVVTAITQIRADGSVYAKLAFATNGSRTVDFYDAAGVAVTEHLVRLADGSETITRYAADGSIARVDDIAASGAKTIHDYAPTIPGFKSQVVHVDAAGAVTDSTQYRVGGAKLSTNVNGADGSRTRDFFALDGSKISTETYGADGSSHLTLFGSAWSPVGPSHFDSIDTYGSYNGGGPQVSTVVTLLGTADTNLTGANTADTLTGNSGANVIYGRGGADLIDGKLGADTLTGGAEADVFGFSTALGPDNVDVITDFTSGADSFLLSQAIFASLDRGVVGADAFTVGTAATTADQHLIYDQTSGSLSYDSDGVGGAAQVEFARVTPNLALAAGDFKVA